MCYLLASETKQFPRPRLLSHLVLLPSSLVLHQRGKAQQNLINLDHFGTKPSE